MPKPHFLGSFRAAVLRRALVVPAIVALSASATATPESDLSTSANDHFGLAASTVTALVFDPRPELPGFTALEIDGALRLASWEPVSVRAASFALRRDRQGSVTTSVPASPRTVRGTLLGVPGSTISGSLLPDGLYLKIRMPDGSVLWIEPLAGRLDGAGATDHVMYRDEDVISCGGECAGAELDALARAADDVPPAQAGGGEMLCTAEIACDADVEFFEWWGSTAGAVDRIELVLNTMNEQFEHDVNITHEITQIIVRETEPDPYSATGANALLQQFSTHWGTNHANVQRDVAQLFTGKNIDGSTIGIAWLGQICQSLGYSVVQNLNGALACVTDLSAHELGHNWSAGHCSCNGPDPDHDYTMNATILCANQFHPDLSVPSIVAHRDSRACLECNLDPFNQAPVLGNLVATPAQLEIGEDLALTATDVLDVDGFVASVRFYRDANDDGGLDVGSDVLLGTDFDDSDGWSWSGSTDDFEVGTNSLIALARDDLGLDSDPAVTTATFFDPFLPAPDAPTGFVATDGSSSDHVVLTWFHSTGAELYVLLRSIAPDGIDDSIPLDTSNNGNGSVRWYVDDTVTPDVAYNYWVMACNDGGCSAFVGPEAGSAATPLAPGAPGDLVATDGTSTAHVLLTWSHIAGADEYEVWRAVTPGTTDDATLIGTGGNGSGAFRWHTDSAAIPGVTYTYWVKACSDIGCSDFSNSDNGSRGGPAPPASPANLVASDGSSSAWVLLTWSHSTGATQYEIWRATSGASSATATHIATSNNGSGAYRWHSDATAVAGVHYTYWVKACSSAGCSDFSNGDSGHRAGGAPAAPAAPVNLVASDGTNAAYVLLTWNHSTGATSYQIWRSVSPAGSGAASHIATANNGSGAFRWYTDATAAPGVVYNYFVKACSSAGCSGYSPGDQGHRP